MGNVMIGVLPSHTTDVSPIFAGPASSSPPGLRHTLRSGIPAPASAALGAPCGLAQSRIKRSATAFGIGLAVPRPGSRPAPRTSSSQAYLPLTTSMLEYALPFGSVHL